MAHQSIIEINASIWIHKTAGLLNKAIFVKLDDRIVRSKRLGILLQQQPILSQQVLFALKHLLLLTAYSGIV